MKRFFLLALTAGLLSPIAAKAETYWLILKTTQGAAAALEKIEVPSMKQCHEQGEVWLSGGFSADKPKKTGKAIWHTAYKCLIGK